VIIMFDRILRVDGPDVARAELAEADDYWAFGHYRRLTL